MLNRDKNDKRKFFNNSFFFLIFSFLKLQTTTVYLCLNLN